MVMRHPTIIAGFSVFLLLHTSAFAYVHPVWGTVTPGSSSPSSARSLPTGNYWQSSTAATQENALKKRTCERILKRFSSDPSALDRVNPRLQERFGFTCSSEDGAAGRREGRQGQSEYADSPAELKVARDAFNPVNDFVPRGASRIPMLRAVLSASCIQDVTIDDITIKDTGAGIPSDLSGVWMAIEGERMSRARLLNRDKTVQLRFRESYVLPACKSVTVDFYAAVSSSALPFGRHTFSIEGPESFTSDTPVAGEFPIAGERMSISSSNTGKLSVSYLPIDMDPRVDGSDREVLGRFRIDLDSIEDQTIHAVTVRNNGTSRDGDVLGIYARSTQGRARFTEVKERVLFDQVYLKFDPPFPVEKGGFVELDIVGNVAYGTGRTLQVGVEEPIDIYAVGSFYGFGRNGQLYGSEVRIEGAPRVVKIKGTGF